MAFFLKAIGLSDDIPNFPFTPDTNGPSHVVLTSSLLSWTVRSGTASDDTSKKVSIFTCALTGSVSSHNDELKKQLARNALRRAKSLMIPGFLKCHGATEYRDTIYIATEECVALKDVLGNGGELRTQLYGATSEEYHASVAYGVNTVGEALAALHGNRLVHGNVHCGTVFVSPSSGVWRLFGLELVSTAEEVTPGSPGSLYDAARRSGVLEGYHCPPEFAPSAGGAGQANASAAADAFAVDSWGMACLLYESVSAAAQEAARAGGLDSLVHKLSSADLRNACRQSLPKALHSGCSALTAANPRMRKSVQAFLETCEFIKDCAFVQYMKELSEVLLLDVTQQVRLVESLGNAVDGFPLRPALSLVLPRLSELLRTATKPGSAAAAAGVSFAAVVTTVLKLASRTSAGEDFERHITPLLTLLYLSPDPLTRYKLLVGAEVYGGKVSAAALTSTIWPLYARGFQHTTPSVREYSARALVHLAPHLSEAVLRDQVPKALGLLQRDQDGALRANATIALHLIAGFITPPSQRANVLLTYCRPMLRDAFEPSRVAALRSLRGAMDCLTAKQVAEGVLPAVAPLSVDPTSEESRSAALALMKAALGKLEEQHRELTAQQSAAAAAASAQGSADRAGQTAAGSAQPTTLPHTTTSSSSTTATTSAWGWSMFNGSPSATPATAGLPPSAAAGSVGRSTPGYHDPFPTAASSPSSSVLRASPLPSGVGAAAAAAAGPGAGSRLPAPFVATSVSASPAATAASGGGGGSGWSDDDDDVSFGEKDAVETAQLHMPSTVQAVPMKPFGSHGIHDGGKARVGASAAAAATATALPSAAGVVKAPVKDSDGWDDFDGDDDGGDDHDDGSSVGVKPLPATKPFGTAASTGASLNHNSSGSVTAFKVQGGASVSPGTGGVAGARATTTTSSAAASSSSPLAMPITKAVGASAAAASPYPSTVSLGGSTNSLSSLPVGGQNSAPPGSPAGPMKLRKKGGLGAARLD